MAAASCQAAAMATSAAAAGQRWPTPPSTWATRCSRRDSVAPGWASHRANGPFGTGTFGPGGGRAGDVGMGGYSLWGAVGRECSG